MKRVAITGASGLLGSMAYKVLKDSHKLVLIFRDKSKLNKLEKYCGNASRHKSVFFDFKEIYHEFNRGFERFKTSPGLEEFGKKVGSVDAFINCAGIINRYANIDPGLTFFINSALPHLLSRIYKEKLIHVTTDCVFNGIVGAPYNEKSIRTPTDIYGLSKSLGEPGDKSLVFRTSVIGPEIDNFVSLLEWFKKQNGKEVPGFTSHFWNGITSRQFALICENIIANRSKFPKNGLFHLYSDSLTKYDMLNLLQKKYGTDVKVKPVKTNPIDRRLTSIYNFCRDLQIPPFTEMLSRLN